MESIAFIIRYTTSKSVGEKELFLWNIHFKVPKARNLDKSPELGDIEFALGHLAARKERETCDYDKCLLS